MDACINALGDTALQLMLDASNGYWKVEIDEADRDKTAFTSHHGLNQFVRMPYGLRNALATFRQIMDVILPAVIKLFALAYVDVIVVFLKSPGRHCKHVLSVLTLLSDVDATPKLKVCHFFGESINYLGHVIFPRSLRIASHTTDAIRKLQPPTSLTKLRSFVGLCSVFRRLVPKLPPPE